MSELRKIRSLFTKNAKQIWRDRIRMFSMLLFPIVMIGLFGSAVGSRASGLTTGVVYREDSDLAQEVVRGFHSAETFNVKRRVGSIGSGEDMIGEGELEVLVILPPDLKEKVESGSTASIGIMVDEANPQIAQTSLSAAKRVIEALSSKISVRLTSKLDRNLKSVKEALREASTSSKRIEGTLQDLGKRLERIRRNLGRTSSSLEDLSESLEGIEKGLEGLSESEIGLSSLENLVEDTEDLVWRSENIPQQQKIAILGNLATIGRGLDQIEVATQSYTSSASKLEGSVEKVEEGIQSLSRGLEGSVREIGAAESISEESAEGVGRTAEGLERTSEGMEGWTDGDSNSLSNPLKFEREVAYGKDLEYIDFLAPGIIGLTIFMGAVMGLGRAVAGERKEGSLTRIFLTPTSNLTILFGTGVFYWGFEFLRGLLILFASIFLFGLMVSGSFFLLFLTLGIFALGSVGLGLLISSLARSEEQFRAVSMIVVMPMMFISGVFFPVHNMPGWLQSLSKLMPLRYAADALRGIMVKDLAFEAIFPELTFLTIFALVTLLLGGVLFRREVVT